MPIRAVLFDVFGTLVDTGSVSQRAEELFPGNGAALSNLWREKQLVYTRLRGLGGRYINFTGLTEDALMSAADSLRLPLDAASRGALMHEFSQLKTFSDVLPALKRMRDTGTTMGIISNGDAALLEDVVRNAELSEYLDLILSADQVQNYKPAQVVYEMGPQTLKHPASELLFVSANAWDAVGAAWAGYQSVWINRTDMAPERLGANFVATGRTLDVAARYLTDHLST